MICFTWAWSFDAAKPSAASLHVSMCDQGLYVPSPLLRLTIQFACICSVIGVLLRNGFSFPINCLFLMVTWVLKNEVTLRKWDIIRDNANISEISKVGTPLVGLIYKGACGCVCK